MKKFTLTVMLMLAMPCAMMQASNNDLATIKYLFEKYDECIKKAKNEYWHLSQKEDLKEAMNRCERVYQPNSTQSNSYLEKSHDLQQKELANLRTRIECLEALQRRR